MRSEVTGIESPSSPRPFALEGRSRAFVRMRERVERIAGCDRPVLIHGPTGAGKEQVARALHAWSGRGGALVAVCCGATSEEALEVELFGRAARARGGAGRRDVGALEAARDGTLLLDEVAELPATIQLRLLRVLELRRYQTVDGEEREFLGRVVAITGDDLLARVAARTFRQDLYYRLAAFAVRVPALSERREDIALLARQVLASVGSATRIERGAERALEDYTWPGNIRQLRSVVERAALFAGDVVDAACVARELAAEGHGARPRAGAQQARERLRELAREVLAQPVRHPVAAMRRALVEEALALEEGDVVAASRRLGVACSALEPSSRRESRVSEIPPPPVDRGGRVSVPPSAMMRRPAPTPVPGELLDGAIEVREVLGTGGECDVFRAWHRGIGAEVAVKVARGEVLEEAIERLQVEVLALDSVRHPNLVRMLDARVADDRCMVVLEVHDPRPMSTRGLFAPRAAVRVIGEVAGALGALHAQGWSHGDVKPENVLFAADGRAVLTDLGLARHPALELSAGRHRATPAFTAPERIAHPDNDGPAADQYALALTAYIALTGEHPFTCGSATAMYLAHLATVPPPPSTRCAAAAPFDDVLRRALAKDPADRFASVEGFAAAMRDALRRD